MCIILMECKVFFPSLTKFTQTLKQSNNKFDKQKYETLISFYRIQQTQHKVISRSTKWQTKMENSQILTKLHKYK